MRSMYDESIALALPEANPADYAEIEDIMRYDILHSELDWVPSGQFRKTARLAYEVLIYTRDQSTGVTEALGERNGRKTRNPNRLP